MKVIPYLWLKQSGKNFEMIVNKKLDIWVLPKTRNHQQQWNKGDFTINKEKN
jgi:hypothetical protein